MKRVGMVIGQLSMGGAERQLHEACIRLGKHEIEPIVYCLSERTEPYGPLLASAGVAVRSFPRASHFDLGRALRLRRASHRDGVDLLHAWLIDDNPYAFAAACASRRGFIASLRSRPLHRDSVRRGIDRLVFRMADRVVANSREVEEHLETVYGLPKGRVEILENGIDPSRLAASRPRHEVRAEIGAAEGDFVLLYVGRLHPVKRLPFLLESFGEFHRRSPHSVLWLAGEGEEREPLESLAVELGIEKAVAFLGNRTDVGDLYRAADLFVLCSESEGLPNVVLEAMACRLPALVSPGAGCRDLIQDGQNGWICREMTPQNFSQTLLEIEETVEKRAEIGLSAEKTVLERFTVDRMVRRLAGIYLDFPHHSVKKV